MILCRKKIKNKIACLDATGIKQCGQNGHNGQFSHSLVCCGYTMDIMNLSYLDIINDRMEGS